MAKYICISTISILIITIFYCLSLTEAMKCGFNARHQSCGSSCPDNCQNYTGTPRICPQQCVSACRCRHGFIFRNGTSGTCIPPIQC